MAQPAQRVLKGHCKGDVGPQGEQGETGPAGSTVLAGLTDVDIDSSLADGDMLVWNASEEKWIAVDPSSSAFPSGPQGPKWRSRAQQGQPAQRGRRESMPEFYR